MVDTRVQFDRLAHLYLPIGVAIFVLVVTVFGVFLWRYRGGAPPDRRAEGSKVELLWIAVVAAIVTVLVAATFRVEDRVDALARAPAVEIGVVAAKWDWRFDYPDGTTSRDVVVVPAGRAVRFSAVSIDVLHDFWVPDLRFQRQVWPDHRERFDLVFPEARRYQGLCAWFCGLYHKDMRFEVRALPAAAFDRWLRKRTR